MAVVVLLVENPIVHIPCVVAAKQMLDFVNRMKKEKGDKGETYFDIRIGIHTGPVVAGIVGSRKFAFDLWGEAVNTASRCESLGKPGEINISHATYERVKDKVKCVHRGKIFAKGMGETDMYFVDHSSVPKKYFEQTKSIAPTGS